MTDELFAELRRLQPGELPQELSQSVLPKAKALLAAPLETRPPRTRVEKMTFALVVFVCLLQSTWLVAFFSR